MVFSVITPYSDVVEYQRSGVPCLKMEAEDHDVNFIAVKISSLSSFRIICIRNEILNREVPDTKPTATVGVTSSLGFSV